MFRNFIKRKTLFSPTYHGKNDLPHTMYTVQNYTRFDLFLNNLITKFQKF